MPCAATLFPAATTQRVMRMRAAEEGRGPRGEGGGLAARWRFRPGTACFRSWMTARRISW